MIKIKDDANNTIYMEYDDGRWFRFDHDENRRVIYTETYTGFKEHCFWVINEQKDWSTKTITKYGMYNYNYPQIKLII